MCMGPIIVHKSSFGAFYWLGGECVVAMVSVLYVDHVDVYIYRISVFFGGNLILAYFGSPS